MRTLNDISNTTMEKLFNVTLPLLTGLEYDTKIIRTKIDETWHKVTITFEITESGRLSIDLDELKKAFEKFIDKENFNKNYETHK